jgi:hypothetical protein
MLLPGRRVAWRARALKGAGVDESPSKILTDEVAENSAEQEECYAEAHYAEESKYPYIGLGSDKIRKRVHSEVRPPYGEPLHPAWPDQTQDANQEDSRYAAQDHDCARVKPLRRKPRDLG